MIISPSAGVVLVELAPSNYGNFRLPEKTYDSITSGTVIAVPSDDEEHQAWVGRTAYWRAYKDDCRVPAEDGRKLALIEIKDILGTAYVSTDTAA